MAQELDVLVAKVRGRWNQTGLTINPVEQESIQAAESRLGFAFPSEHASLLRSLGVPTDQDALGFRFWHPDSFTSIREATADRGRDGMNLGAYVFADYLDESWWYAVLTQGIPSGLVARARGAKDGNHAEPLLNNVNLFFEAYLADDPILYGTPNAQTEPI